MRNSRAKYTLPPDVQAELEASRVLEEGAKRNATTGLSPKGASVSSKTTSDSGVRLPSLHEQSSTSQTQRNSLANSDRSAARGVMEDLESRRVAADRLGAKFANRSKMHSCPGLPNSSGPSSSSASSQTGVSASVTGVPSTRLRQRMPSRAFLGKPQLSATPGKPVLLPPSMLKWTAGVGDSENSGLLDEQGPMLTWVEEEAEDDAASAARRSSRCKGLSMKALVAVKNPLHIPDMDYPIQLH